jgi:hypothetical protein
MQLSHLIVSVRVIAIVIAIVSEPARWPRHHRMEAVWHQPAILKIYMQIYFGVSQ